MESSNSTNSLAHIDDFPSDDILLSHTSTNTNQDISHTTSNIQISSTTTTGITVPSTTPLHVVDALADMEHELRTAKATLALAENNKLAAENKALVLEKALIDALRHISGMDKVIEHGILNKTSITRTLRLPLEHLHDKNKEAITTLTQAIGEAMGATLPSNSYENITDNSNDIDTQNNNDTYPSNDNNNNNPANNNDWDNTQHINNDNNNTTTKGLGIEDISYPSNNNTNGSNESTIHHNEHTNDNHHDNNTVHNEPVTITNPSSQPNPSHTDSTQTIKQVRKTYQKLLYQTCSVTNNRVHPLVNPETLARIFTYLDGHELGKVTQVCRSWRSLPLRSDFRLWRLYSRQGILPKSLRSSIWQNILYTSTDMIPGEEITWDRELVSLLFGWVGPEAAAGPKRPLRHRTIAKLLILKPGWRQIVQHLEKLEIEKKNQENQENNTNTDNNEDTTNTNKEQRTTSNNDTDINESTGIDNNTTDDEELDTSTYPLTLRTSKPRHIIDHTLRLNMLPHPISLKIPINEEEKLATPSKTSATSEESDTTPTNTTESSTNTPTATLPSQLIYEHYLQAGIANQKASDAVRSCKEAANMVRRLRGEKARLNAELERAVEEGKGFPAALSHEYTERDAELTIAETNVRTFAEHARELIQLAHTALRTADEFFLNSLLDARRKWVQAVIRSWIIQQRRGIPHGSIQPLLLHNYTLPVSGCTVPTLGVKLPVANINKQLGMTIGSSSTSSTISSSNSVSANATASLSAAASPAITANTGSSTSSAIPVLNLSSVPSTNTATTTASTGSVPPLPPSTSSNIPMGSPPSYVPSSNTFYELSPFFPLPLRLQRLLQQKIADDYDSLQEETLGLKYVSLPTLPVNDTKDTSNNTHIPIRSYTSTPNDGAQAHPIMFELGSPRRMGGKHSSNNSKNPTPVAMADTGFVPTTTVNPSTTGESSTNTSSAQSNTATASVNSETTGAAALPQDSNDFIFLPAPPFTSQHLLIDADVRRTFGDLDKALNTANTDNENKDTPIGCKLTDLFPTAYISPSTPNVFTRTSLNALRASLKDILIAYTAFDHGAVGYCQGMNFLAATFLRHDNTPHTAFWGLAALVNSPLYAFRDMFSSGLYKVGLSFYTLKELLHRHNPRLENHLRNLGIRPDMYVAGWVMCLFSSMETLPLSQVAALWDSFLLNGWKSLWRVVLTLLDGVSTECVEATDMATIVTLLHQYPKERLPPSPSALLRRAYRIKVTSSILRDITIRYDRFKCPWRYINNKHRKLYNGQQSRMITNNPNITTVPSAIMVNTKENTINNTTKSRSNTSTNPSGQMTIHNPNTRSRAYSESLSNSQNNSSEHDDIAWASGHSAPMNEDNMPEDNNDDNDDDDAYFSDDNEDDEGGNLGGDSMLAALWAAGGMKNNTSSRRRNKQTANNAGGGLMQWMFWRKPSNDPVNTASNNTNSQPLSSMVNRNTVNTSFVGGNNKDTSNTWFGSGNDTNANANHTSNDNNNGNNNDKDIMTGVRSSRASSLAISTRSSGRGIDELMNNKSRRSSLTNTNDNSLVPGELDFALENINNDNDNNTRRSRVPSVASVRSTSNNNGPVNIPSMNLIPPASVMKTSLSDFTNMTGNSPLSQSSSIPTFSMEEADSNSEANTPQILLNNNKEPGTNTSASNTPLRGPHVIHKGVPATPDVLAAFSTADDAAFDNTGSPFFPGHHNPSATAPNSSHAISKTFLQGTHHLAHTLSMGSIPIPSKLGLSSILHTSPSTGANVNNITKSPLQHANNNPSNTNSPNQPIHLNTTNTVVPSWEPFKDGEGHDTTTGPILSHSVSAPNATGEGTIIDSDDKIRYREKVTHSVNSWGTENPEVTSAIFPNITGSDSRTQSSTVPQANNESVTVSTGSMLIHNENNIDIHSLGTTSNDAYISQSTGETESSIDNSTTEPMDNEAGTEEEHVEWPEPELHQDNNKGTNNKGGTGGGLLTSGLQVMKSRFSRILGANEEETTSAEKTE